MGSSTSTSTQQPSEDPPSSSTSDATPSESTTDPSIPIHDTPISGMIARPRVAFPAEFGDATDFWVEYPSGLVDVSRTAHLPAEAENDAEFQPPPLKPGQLEIPVDGDRVVRVDNEKTALVIIDMQK